MHKTAARVLERAVPSAMMATRKRSWRAHGNHDSQYELSVMYAWVTLGGTSLRLSYISAQLCLPIWLEMVRYVSYSTPSNENMIKLENYGPPYQLRPKQDRSGAKPLDGELGWSGLTS
jgi:hypothetical protein